MIALYQEFRSRVDGPLTRLLLYLLLKVNPYKDRQLSWKLHAIADDYDPRPTGAWR